MKETFQLVNYFCGLMRWLVSGNTEWLINRYKKCDKLQRLQKFNFIRPLLTGMRRYRLLIVTIERNGSSI